MDVDPRDNVFTIHMPQKILFGEGSVKEASRLIDEFKVQSILFITDATINRMGLSSRVLTPLLERGLKIKVFDEVEPEPSIECAERVAAAAREHHPDLVVGMGGGSSLDMAKMASISAANPGPIARFIGVGKVPRPGIPKILVPTTSGTGSEATKYLIISDREGGLKRGIETPYNIADAVVVDPLLTLSVPPKVTSATGLDALTHAFESVMSVDSNPFSETLAFKAITLILKSLPTAYREGGNVPARRDMSLAAMLAGISINISGVCAGHAAAYTFAVKHKTPHGVSCALALPYVMEYNFPTCHPVFTSVAEAAGIGKPGESEEEKAFKMIQHVRSFIGEVDSPLSLRRIGVVEDEVEGLIEDFLKIKRLLAHNPREIPGEDARSLFQRMYEGHPPLKPRL